MRKQIDNPNAHLLVGGLFFLLAAAIIAAIDDLIAQESLRGAKDEHSKALRSALIPSLTAKEFGYFVDEVRGRTGLAHVAVRPAAKSFSS